MRVTCGLRTRPGVTWVCLHLNLYSDPLAGGNRGTRRLRCSVQWHRQDMRTVCMSRHPGIQRLPKVGPNPTAWPGKVLSVMTQSHWLLLDGTKAWGPLLPFGPLPFPEGLPSSRLVLQATVPRACWENGLRRLRSRSPRRLDSWRDGWVTPSSAQSANPALIPHVCGETACAFCDIRGLTETRLHSGTAGRALQGCHRQFTLC